MNKFRIILSGIFVFFLISPGNFVQAEELYMPLAAEEAIDRSQSQLTVSGIEYPDGTVHSRSGQGFLREDGLVVSALHIYAPPEFKEKDEDILTKKRTVTFNGAHADIVYASGFKDLALFKLRRIPAGMKPAVFAKKIKLFEPVFARIKSFLTFEYRGEIYGYFLDLPYKGILVNSLTVYKNVNKSPEATDLELIFLDQTAKSGFSGAMFVNSNGEVIGMGDAIDGGYTINISSIVTIQKAIDEYKSGISSSGKKQKIENEPLDSNTSGDKDAALAPDLLKAFEQADIFKEILGYYKIHSLDRPKDMVKCAQEMLAMQSNGECRDRFTHYFTPEQAKARNNESSLKEDVGIGISLKELEGKVIVIGLTADLPAQKAGIKPGDIIVELNGIVINKVDEFIKMIRQLTAGTEIKIIINRHGETLPFVVPVEKIDVSAVSFKSFFKDGKPTVGYTKITDFMHYKVVNDFNAAFVQFEKQGIGNVVMDLRNNNGGRLDYALQMLALFMKADDIAITMRTRISSIPVDRREMRDYFDVDEFSIFRDMKIVILINEESASASEIFAGAMQDWGVAKIVGRASFGKGVGQDCFDLSDNSLFCLTTFEFVVGNHNVVIRDKGVIPDIEVEPGEDSLQKALEFLWKD
ncbi:MAG: PDZ domain-containing protein [Candidatus Brennerbacteria bacterium]|nr:PDZ domain-containing protein [Candidatus Brennerbacteria bacterium]